MQNKCVDFLVFKRDIGGRRGGFSLLATLWGESLILQLTVTMIGGIILVIVPFLALTANQMSRIKEAVQSYRSIEAHYLDEVSDSDT